MTYWTQKSKIEPTKFQSCLKLSAGPLRGHQAVGEQAECVSVWSEPTHVDNFPGLRPMPPTPKGPNMRFLVHLGPSFGSGRASELSMAAIGFIWTKFQVKWCIPEPVWTHSSFWDFLDPA